MIKIPIRVVSPPYTHIMRMIRVYPPHPTSQLNVTGTSSAIRLNFPTSRRTPFVPYPFCPRSSPSNGIINGLAGGLATSRKRDRAGSTPRTNKIRLRRLAAPGSSLSLGKWPARGFLNSTWMADRIHHCSLFLFLLFSLSFSLSLSLRFFCHHLIVCRIHRHRVT